MTRPHFPLPSSSSDAMAEWPVEAMGEDHRISCRSCKNKSGMFCVSLTRQCGRQITHVPVDVLHDCSEYAERGRR